MTGLEKKLVRACEELDLQIDLPFEAAFGPNKVSAVARIRDLGAKNGMLVVRSFSDVNAISDELIEAGYGFCAMDEPKQEFNLDAMIDMFSDWGWSGRPERKPSWMRDPEPLDSDDG